MLIEYIDTNTMANNMANNPQTFMNTYLSAIRNTIISLTLGIGIFSFSKTFKDKKSSLILRFLSIILYFYSFTTVLNTALMLHAYLKKMENLDEKEKAEIPEYINFKFWKIYLILGYTLCAIVMLLILLALQRFIKKLF